MKRVSVRSAMHVKRSRPAQCTHAAEGVGFWGYTAGHDDARGVVVARVERGEVGGARGGGGDGDRGDCLVWGAAGGGEDGEG